MPRNTVVTFAVPARITKATDRMVALAVDAWGPDVDICWPRHLLGDDVRAAQQAGQLPVVQVRANLAAKHADQVIVRVLVGTTCAICAEAQHERVGMAGVRRTLRHGKPNHHLRGATVMSIATAYEIAEQIATEHACRCTASASAYDRAQRALAAASAAGTPDMQAITTEAMACHRYVLTHEAFYDALGRTFAPTLSPTARRAVLDMAEQIADPHEDLPYEQMIHAVARHYVDQAGLAALLIEIEQGIPA